MKGFQIEQAAGLVGREIALSRWVTLSQPMVTAFAETTLDPDWMHVDGERSRQEGPFGGTIVQGFLMLSLVIRFAHDYGAHPAGMAYALNYGLDRVRFTAPVRTGSRVRDRIVLADVRERGAGRWLVRTTHTFEVDGETRPALVADWLELWFQDLDD